MPELTTNNSFTENYTTAALAEEGKTQIGADAYAIGQVIELLIKKIEQTRLSLRIK